MLKHISMIPLTILCLIFSIPLNITAQQYSVMTYNIRWNNPDDGVNTWEERKSELVEFLASEKPDLLGIQEGLIGQLNYMSEMLPQYNMIGVGRDDGKESGEFTAIFYKKKKFNLIAQSSFWLSENSGEISVGWDAALPRICTYGILEDAETMDRIHVFNTHFDHVGSHARLMSSKLIIEKIESITNEHSFVLLMGDFNCTPDSEPVQEIKNHLQAGMEISKNGMAGPMDTYNGFTEEPLNSGKIDHIFVRNFSVNTYRHIDKRRKNNLQLSDHFAVVAEISLTKKSG